jgi:hypothetical protein
MHYNNYDRLYRIVSSDLLRRTASDTPFNSYNVQYKHIYHDEFIPIASSSATKKALSYLRDWLVSYDDNILGACFFGSTVSNTTSEESITVPKKHGEYVNDLIMIGPSDVDGLIVTKGGDITLPTIYADYKTYNAEAVLVDTTRQDLLSNIFIIPIDCLTSSIIFEERLFAMYYRMLIKAGFWIKDNDVSSLIKKHAGNRENEILLDAKQFYARRIRAIIGFLQSLCLNRVESGYMYGHK